MSYKLQEDNKSLGNELTSYYSLFSSEVETDELASKIIEV